MAEDNKQLELSDRARLVYCELEKRVSGGCVIISKQELVQAMRYSIQKVTYTLAELVGAGLIAKTEGDCGPGWRLLEDVAPKRPSRFRVVQPSPVYLLVQAYVRLRMVQEPNKQMISRLMGEAKKALKENDLQELLACMEWLNTEQWWSRQNWSLSAVAGTGLMKYRRAKSRQSAAPGSADVKEGTPDFSVRSLIPQQYKNLQEGQFNGKSI